MYDTIIVGAGPAGSMLAKKLADADLKVLLVEQEKVPRHKMCSGVISSFARRVLKKEGLGEVPSIICCHPKKLKGVQIYPTKAEPPQRWREKSCNVWRSDFDFWLNIKANEAGAKVLDQTKLVGFKEKTDGITVNLKTQSGEQIEKAKILVGADGGTSSIRRKLFSNEKITWFSAYQEYWKGDIDLDENYLHTFLDREFSEFFAVLNIKTGSKGKYIIINTNALKGSTISAFFRKFQEYLEEAHGFRGRECVFKEACISPKFFDPTYDYKFGRNRILLIGEAAGLFNVFAEGISPALISAVNATAGILRGPDQALEVYIKQIQPLLSSMKTGWETLLKMFPHFITL